MTPTKLEERLSSLVPKTESQVSGVSHLILKNVSASFFITLLPEMHR